MNIKRKLNKLRGESPLKDSVIDYWLDEDNIKEQMESLQKYGCVSGMIGTLIYYNDTEEFYNRHKEEINEIAYEIVESCGYNSIFDLMGDVLDKDDQLFIETSNKNRMAWFGFEETSYKLYEELFEGKEIFEEMEVD